jgi:hypothetical protein
MILGIGRTERTLPASTKNRIDFVTEVAATGAGRREDSDGDRSSQVI